MLIEFSICVYRILAGEKPYVCSVCNKAFSDASNWKKHERMHSRQIQSAFEDGVVSVVTSAPPTPEPMTPNSPTLSVSQMPNMSIPGPHLGSPLSSFVSNMAHLSLPTSTGPSGMFPEVTSSLSILSHGMSHNTHPSSSNSQNSEDSNDLSPPAKRNKDDSLSCNICAKSFSTPASLSMHKKIHSGEKPHQCGTCGKSFTQIGTLRAHERVHTGEKPYECNICGKTFAQCGSFRMHERRHHRDMMENFQKCFVCGASFSTIEDLQKHLMCHPGALNLNLHAGGLGYGGPLPLSFGFPPDIDKPEHSKPDIGEMSELEKAFSLFAGQPKSGPVVSLNEHYHLPPFASTAHALLQRSLSQGNDHNTAVSMLLASNGGPDNLSLLGQSYTSPGLLSNQRLPLLPPERDQSASITHDSVKHEEVEPVSTTTRSRKYSSDSHTSLQDGQASDNKMKSQVDEEQEQETDVPSHCQKTPSEDSSLAESRSTEDFQSDDQQQNGIVGSISRRNLNKRMISTTNSRKQRRPMRRLSANAIVDPSAYQHQYNNEEGAETGEEEELTKDQLMVSFLLSKGEVYKCEHCHIIFEDCSLYLLHNGFHSNDSDPFKCVICKKSCNGRMEFNCHLTSHIK